MFSQVAMLEHAAAPGACLFSATCPISCHSQFHGRSRKAQILKLTKPTFFINLNLSGLYFTCASVNPNMAASWRLSGFVTYFWTSNLFSSPFLCRCENTALDHERFLLGWLESLWCAGLWWCWWWPGSWWGWCWCDMGWWPWCWLPGVIIEKWPGMKMFAI